MENETSGSIDHSCWISLKDIESYVSSLVESGIKQWNGKSIILDVRGMPPLDRLAMARAKGGEELITESQRTAGYKFQIITHCAHGIPARIYETESEATQTSAVLKKIAIEKQLNGYHKQMLQYIIEERVKEHEYNFLRTVSSAVYNAFDSLERAMTKDNLQKALDDLRRNVTMLPIRHQTKCV